MVEIENINYLRKNFPEVRKFTKDHYKHSNVKVIKSKRDLPTLTIENDGRILYLHSKYDPIQEAEKLVEQYSEELSGEKNVFFYGIGLGYHVEAIIKQYPDISITLYEPNIDAFQSLINTKLIKNLGDKSIKHLFVETSEENRNQFLRNFANEVNNDVLLITLPSYERLFKEEYQNFVKVFTNEVKNKRSNLKTNTNFQRRWTLNSIKNLRYTLSTPNLLDDTRLGKFEGEAAIIVAAGPSLNDDLETIRHIKENNLAYIFAVGSAINTLISADILPHAACTYDPGEKNQYVFQKANETGLDIEIPLFYGSSVGYEVLENYKGPKYHMLINQDTFTPYIVNEQLKNPTYLIDSPSIAVVTTQLLCKLGFSTIIFAGQNLAYKNNVRYSKGIEYNFIKNEITEGERESALLVKNVDGENIQTNQGFLNMKNVLESVIKANQNSERKFINTTSGGANISGTECKTLDHVVEAILDREIIDSDRLYNSEKTYHYDDAVQRLKDAAEELSTLIKLIINTQKALVKLSEVLGFDDDKVLKYLNQFDSHFKKMSSNKFYKQVIMPMVRVENDFLSKRMKGVKFEKDVQKKAQVVSERFLSYIITINELVSFIDTVYKEVFQEIVNPSFKN